MMCFNSLQMPPESNINYDNEKALDYLLNEWVNAQGTVYPFSESLWHLIMSLSHCSSHKKSSNKNPQIMRCEWRWPSLNPQHFHSLWHAINECYTNGRAKGKIFRSLILVYIPGQKKRGNYSYAQNLLKSCCLTWGDRGRRKFKVKMETLGWVLLWALQGPSDVSMPPK